MTSAATVVSTFLLFTATIAAQVPLGAVLNGTNEVPPVPTAATGTARLNLNLPSQTLSYRVVTSGLVGTAAHIHVGTVGVNGGVLFGLTGGPSIWEGTTPPLTNAQVTALLTEGYYINVHSATFPGGEIRGQVVPHVRRPLIATLDGAQETPPVVTAASGTATAFLNLPFRTVDYDVRTTGVAGTVAHIHVAPFGISGPVVKPLVGSPSQWAGTTTPMTAAQASDLLAGNHYINVHSAAHPGGEIRGQLQKSTSIRFIARMNGGEEVPSVATPGTGYASFTLDEVAGLLAYDISTSGLTAPISAAHIHLGVLRQNGGVIINLAPPAGASAWSGSAAVTPAQIDALYRGSYYVNVHTTMFPGGEVRGQIFQNPMTFGFGFDGGGSERRIDALSGGPFLGSPLTITLTNAPGGAPCNLFLSDNTTSLLGGPLPLFSPAGPIWIDAGALFFIPAVANSIGSASFTITVPASPAAIGLAAYWQWLINEPAGPTVSNALQTIIQ